MDFHESSIYNAVFSESRRLFQPRTSGTFGLEDSLYFRIFRHWLAKSVTFTFKEREQGVLLSDNSLGGSYLATLEIKWQLGPTTIIETNNLIWFMLSFNNKCSIAALLVTFSQLR
jgi:hypothetical protein